MSKTRQGASSAVSSVLPPIINTDQDKRFLHDLNHFIENELDQVDSVDPQQRYTIYKAAFDKVINYVTAYKPLLTAIKAEYEDCVEAIVKGHREAHFMQDKLKAMASEPATIRNFQKRSDELQSKLHVIRGDNEKLASHLRKLREERSEREAKEKEVLEPAQHQLKKDSRHIPGLSVNQETDLKFLSKELVRVDKELRELRNQQRTRYSDRGSKISLKETLTQRVNKRDQLVQQSTLLKAKRHRLKIAVEAAQAYVKIQPPHQTIGDAILLALSRSHPGNLDFEAGGSMTARHTPAPSSFEDDDPGKEKEAEMMLEYIEKFNEMFEDSKYEQAAIHAANSPKGILRTIETLNKFKEVKSKQGERSPLLAFCDAVMASVLALGVKPSETISNECVACALNENRLDLLAHWIAQDRLSVSKQLGCMIRDACQCEFGRCLCESQSLAETIFTRAGEHREAALCLMRQGRVRYAIQYARQHAAFGVDDYITLLQRFPTPTIAAILYKDKIVPIGRLVESLLTTTAYDIGLHLLQDLFEQPPTDSGESVLRTAVFADTETLDSSWSNIISACQTAGNVDVAVELLAAMTVRSAVQSAVDQQKQASLRAQQASEPRREDVKPTRQVNIAEEESEESEPITDSNIFDIMG